jgi:hypothetical protein
VICETGSVAQGLVVGRSSLVAGQNSSAPTPDIAGGDDERPTTNDQIQAYNAEINQQMSPSPDNLAGLKDDMVAFIEGHGMRRFHGYVDYEEVQSVVWKTEDSPDSWKDFVELAKAAAAPFLTMDSWTLRREELDQMVERLGSLEFTSDEDVEEARWLRTYVGKTGFVQLGFAHQGIMMVYEASTDWYDHYQRLLELSEDFGGIPIDEPGPDDEI